MNRTFKLVDKQNPKGDDIYQKYYMRLLAVVIKASSVKIAKKHIKSIYKELSLDVTGKAWSIDDDESEVCL